jgi:hypothetical protein
MCGQPSKLGLRRSRGYRWHLLAGDGLASRDVSLAWILTSVRMGRQQATDRYRQRARRPDRPARLMAIPPLG